MQTMVTTHGEDCSVLPYPEFIAAGAAALAQSQIGRGCDDAAALALVRRAVVDREDRAWATLQQLYGAYVIGWCRRAGAREDALDDCVQATWVKFWQSYTPAKLRSATRLGQVLQYLKLCARSVVLDTTRRRRDLLSLETAAAVTGPRGAPDARLLDSYARAEFWRLVAAQLRNERERVVVHSIYGLGLTSAETLAQRPDLFPTIQDAYRVTRNVLDRLRRNQTLRAWFSAD
jgi:DNA-directed RNA polymerase specialized sigma24 family protein